MPNAIRCPKCSASLRPKVLPPPGTKLRCPRCGATFKTGAKAKKTAAPAGDGFDDDWGAAAPAPVRATRRPAEEPSGPVPVGVWIGLAVAVVLIAGALGLWVLLDDGPAPPATNLAGADAAPRSAGGSAVALREAGVRDGDLPGAAAAPFSLEHFGEAHDLFVHVRVADLWDTPAVRAMVPPALRATADDAAANPYRVALRDVVSMTTGLPAAERFRDSMLEAGTGGPAAARELGRRAGEQVIGGQVTVVRFKEPWSPEEVRGPDGEPVPFQKSEHAGQTIYRFPPGGTPVDIAIWSADERTAVFASETALEAAIDGSTRPFPSRPGFAGLSSNGQLQIAFAPAAPFAGFTGGKAADNARSPEVARLGEALDAHLLAASLDLTVDRGAAGTLTVATDSAAGAKAVSEAITPFTADRSEWRASLERLPPALGDLLSASLDSFDVRAEGTFVKLGVAVPETLTEIGPQLPILIMGAASRPAE